MHKSWSLQRVLEVTKYLTWILEDGRIGSMQGAHLWRGWQSQVVSSQHWFAWHMKVALYCNLPIISFYIKCNESYDATQSLKGNEKGWTQVFCIQTSALSFANCLFIVQCGMRQFSNKSKTKGCYWLCFRRHQPPNIQPCHNWSISIYVFCQITSFSSLKISEQLIPSI